MAQSFNTGLKEVAAHYLRLLQVKITPYSIQKAIEENPYYPSLLSISDAFSSYNIDNTAFEVTEKDFDKLPPPFIAYIDIPDIGKDFVLVTSNTSNTISFFHKGKKKKSIPQEEFLKQYRNIVWLAESNRDSGDKQYNKIRSQESKKSVKKISLYFGISALLFISILLAIPPTEKISFIIITLLKLFGAGITVLLLMYENDKSNFFIKNLCSVGKRANCDAVLGSKAAKIMGVSWGEVGFFYFTTTALWLLFPSSLFSDNIIWIAYANALAAPYIIFSIYYQWKIVKQWCPLCLMVQSIIFIELIWSIENVWWHPYLPIMSFSVLFSLLQKLGFVVVSWYIFKPLFVKSKDASHCLSAYKRLQNNPDIFNSLLIQQPQTPDGWQSMGISIGNPQATNTIIKICNPYCGPCAEAHPELEEILKNKKDVQLKIIFLISDKGLPVIKHLLAVAEEEDISKTQQSLDDWYMAPIKDYEVFAKKYPLKNQALEMQDAKLEAMKKWCVAAEIMYTPTIFVNGYRLPENYDLRDLRALL